MNELVNLRGAIEYTAFKQLIEQGEMVKTEHDGQTFYVRKLIGRRE